VPYSTRSDKVHIGFGKDETNQNMLTHETNAALKNGHLEYTFMRELKTFCLHTIRHKVLSVLEIS